MKRLSIIIPIYNVEHYVEKCLRCLEDQDIPKDDYEIICINDGSPDNSREVVIRLQKEFDNIFLIDQENQGVARARNNGIDKAIGQYLVFIDPDDYVESNSFSAIIKKSEDVQAQVSFLGFTVLNEDGTMRKQIFNKEESEKVYKGIEAYYLARGDGYTDPDRMWGVLFEKDFINFNRCRYLADVPYLEDGEFIARILCLAERCIFYGGMFYWRTTRPGSATNSNLFNSEFAINGFIKAAVNLRSFRDRDELTQKQKEFLNQPITKFVVLSVSPSAKLSKFKIFVKTYLILKDHHFEKLDLKGCNSYYRKLGYLYNSSGYLLYAYFIIRPLPLFIWKLLPKTIK